MKNIFLIYVFAAVFFVSFSGLNASEPFSVRILDNYSGIVEAFPETPIGFMAKFRIDSVLFDVASNLIMEGIEKDSGFEYVIVYHRFSGDDLKPSAVYKFSDYFNLSAEYQIRKMWITSAVRNLGIEPESERGRGMLQGGEIALDIPFRIKSRTFHRVFGGDNIGLRVRGSMSISVIGQRSKSNLPGVQDTSYDFTLDQTQNISISGKVGTKVDVNIAQNTESFDFENSLRITYSGDSNEIIQRLEAGNIGLSLPGTRFVSFSGVNKGLFGLKAEKKIGRLRSTSIASFEKGRKNQIQIRGGVRQQERIRNAKDYLRYRYFYIEDVFRENMATPENYERIREHRPLFAPPVRIRPFSFELYITRTEIGTQRQADIYIDYLNRASVDSIGGYSNLYRENRNITLVPEDQYDINYEMGYIRLKSLHLSGEDILAVRYIRENPADPAQFEEVGGVLTETKMELQILGEFGQEWSHPWNKLEWKNVYSLDGSDIDRDGFEMTIQRDTPGGVRTEEYDINDVSKPYLYWFDVSRPEVNDEVDVGFLRPANGEFIFPNQFPFMPDNNSLIYTEGKGDSLYTDPRIYTDRFYTGSQFNIKFEFASRSSSYDLGFNVLDGSEVVRSGATTLRKDVDYIINYNTGQLTIINDSYLSADIEILYESASFFQLDQKVLLGNRFDYTVNRNTYIGATILYLSEASAQEKVHVGFEPKKNLMLGMNAQTSFSFPHLTRALDALPFITTERESRILMEGEIARVIPNPNPLGAAYIDDFENSRIKRSLGIPYRSWSEASYPDNYSVSGNYILHPGVSALSHPVPLQYFLKSYSGSPQLSFYWYNPKDEDKLTREEIYRDVPGDQKRDRVNTLDFQFRPVINDDAFTDMDFRPEDSWGGVMRYLHSSYQDFRDVKYIEFLVSTSRDITVHFDLGDLSEDVIPNGRLDTEDRNRNGVLDIGENSEDTGLDGMMGPGGFHALDFFDHNDPREKEPFEFYSFDIRPTEPDGSPTPDSQLRNYWDFIKTEGNGRLDTEDLDGGGNLDTSVRANRYSVDLKASPSASDKYVVSTDYRAGSNFALYRIPVEDITEVLNREPDMSRIRYMKIWFNNSSDQVNSTSIRFVTMDLVGNEWSSRGQNKGKIEAKTVNNQDDKGRYYSPPGVRKIDDFGFEEFEQSLAMDINLSGFMSEEEFQNGRQAMLSKELFRSENYLLYEEMKMFIHGGRSANDPTWDRQRPLYYIYRFGTDSVNYYEYRSKLVNGWSGDGISNQMIVKLRDLSDLKTARSDSGNRTDSIFLVPYNDAQIKRYIGIKGNPTLQSVRYFSTGVLDSAKTDLETEIWVNELRLARVLKDPGTAMRAKARIQAADVITLDAEITSQDENFHRIEQSRGSGVNQRNFSFNSSMNVDKVLPRALGVNIPVRYTHSNSSSYTQYQGSTDILVDKSDIPDSVRTQSVRNQVDMSLSRSARSDNPLLKYTVDNMRFSGNASFSNASNPSSVYRKTTNYNYNLTYSLSLPDRWFGFRPFFWGDDIFLIGKLSDMRVVFFPNSYNFSINTGQSETLSLSRSNNFTESRTFLVTRNFSTSLSPLPFINSSYNMSLRSDMYRKAVKKENSEGDSIITVYDRGITDLFSLQFGELSNLESSLNNRMSMNISRFISNSLNFNTTYSWTANLGARTVVTSNMRNKYDSRLNTRVHIKEVLGLVQEGLSRVFSGKEEEDADKSAGGKSGKGTNLLGFLSSNLSDLNLSYNQSRENSFTDIRSLEQADPAFFFGFSEKPKIADSSSPHAWSGSWAANASTRLRISKNLGLDGLGYNFTRNYRQSGNEGFTGNDSETSFVWPFVSDRDHRKTGANEFFLPNYSINITGLQDFFQEGARRRIRTLTLSHSKSGSRSTQWHAGSLAPDMYFTGIPDLRDADITVRGAVFSTSFSPLAGASMNLRNGMNFSLNYNYSYDLRENYSNTDASITSGEKRYTREFRFTAGYNQRGGFNVPLNFWPFSGARLDNDINYNLTVSYSSNDRYRYDIAKGEYEGLDNGIRTENIAVSPNITYRISRNLNGTVSYTYNQNESRSYGAQSVINSNHRFELRAVLSISGR